LTQKFITDLLEELSKLNETTQKTYDKFAEDLKNEMINVNEDLDILV